MPLAPSTTHRRSSGRIRRLIACALAPLALLAADAGAAPAGADHVYGLAGTFACRTLRGGVTHVTGTRDGSAVSTHTDVTPGADPSYGIDERFTFDDATQRWKIDAASPTVQGLEFTAAAAPWTGDTWSVEGNGARDRKILMLTKLLPDGGFRRIFALRANGGWEPYSASLCTPGSAPPAADACIVPNYPAQVLTLIAPDLRTVPPGQPHGEVDVMVSLDAQSHVTATRVQSSPSAYLSSAVIAAARRSVYLTEIRDCKPVPVDYLYRYVFGR